MSGFFTLHGDDRSATFDDLLRSGVAVGPKIAFECASGNLLLELAVRHLYRYESGDIAGVDATGPDHDIALGLGWGGFL